MTRFDGVQSAGGAREVNAAGYKPAGSVEHNPDDIMIFDGSEPKPEEMDPAIKKAIIDTGNFVISKLALENTEVNVEPDMNSFDNGYYTKGTATYCIEENNQIKVVKLNYEIDSQGQLKTKIIAVLEPKTSESKK